MKPSSTGIGFSHQRVPSLSKTAMRASAGTNSGPPRLVTRATKSLMAALLAPSFQEARGSADLDAIIARLPLRFRALDRSSSSRRSC
jgi:hypothetical protein